MTEKRRNIALAGLSGAGKSTLIRAVLKENDFVHLSASDLIKEYIKDRDGQHKTSEKLRLGNITDNQACFVEAFEEKVQSIDRHIILDGSV